MHARHASLVTGLGVVGLLLTGCSSAPTPTPPTPPTTAAEPSAPESSIETDPLDAFYEQELDWRDCGDAECTRVRVPLDYQDPSAGTTELALTKVPATGESIGALFVNPGGPGGSAFDYARAADYIVSPSIRDSFDIVGVDPRGVGKSDPIECLTDSELDEIFASDGTPDDAEEERRLIADSQYVADACESNATEVWRHMDTVSTARDLDIVRVALRQPVLNYLGKSYGSAIGAAYAELFPEWVGRMVLDGAFPLNLSQQEISYRQALAFEDAVDHFATDCVDSGECPFIGDSDQVANGLRSFLTSLDERPLPTRDGRPLTQSLGSYAVLSFLYFPDTDYPRLRSALAEAVNDGDGTALITLVDERVNRADDGRYLDNSTDAFYAVSCADMPFDGTAQDAARLASEWQSEAPTFGAALAWGMLVCADWPAPAAEQLTQLTAAGSGPILVVSTAGDTATPHEWGIALAESLDNGHLVTWDAFHHTAYAQGSACVDRAVDAYLLAGELPTPGLVCS